MHLIGMCLEIQAQSFLRIRKQAAEPVARLRERFMRVVDGIVDAIAGLGEARRDIIAMAANRFGKMLAKRFEPLRHVGSARLEIVDKRFAGRAQPRVDLGNTLCEAVRDAVTRARHLRGRGLAGLRQPLDDFAAVVGQVLHEVGAGPAQRKRDLLALRAERGGDSAAGLADGFGEPHRGRREIARQRFVRADDCGTHLLGIDDDFLALLRQPIDQGADAPLVIGIGALEGGDFGAHHRFKFARTRERAFDSITQGRDFAPDRLRKRHDLLGCHGFRLGEAHRDFGHRARGEPHFLGAARHKRGHEHEDDRPKDSEKRESEFRPAIQGNAVGRHDELAMTGEVCHANRRPDDREEQCRDKRRRARPNPHGLQDGADGLAVFIGRRNGGRQRRRVAHGRPRWDGRLIEDSGRLGLIRCMLTEMSIGMLRQIQVGSGPIVDWRGARFRQLHAGGKRCRIFPMCLASFGRLAFRRRVFSFRPPLGGFAKVQGLFDRR